MDYVSFSAGEEYDIKTFFLPEGIQVMQLTEVSIKRSETETISVPGRSIVGSFVLLRDIQLFVVYFGIIFGREHT